VAKSGGEDEEDPDPSTPSPGQLTNLQIQQMMADAKRMISVRKQALEATKGISLPSADEEPMPKSVVQSPIAWIDMPQPGVLVPPPMLRNQQEYHPSSSPFEGKAKDKQNNNDKP
jgi:hypothetical protein